MQTIIDLFKNTEITLECGPEGVWKITNTDYANPIDASQSVIGRRIGHTKTWCVKHLKSHSFQHITFFDSDDACEACFRDLHFSPNEKGGCVLIISAEQKFNEKLLRLDFDTQILNLISDAILVTTTENIDLPGPRILFVNRAFEEMTGYSLDDVIGLTPRLLQGDDTSDASKAAIRQGLMNWEPITQQLTNYKKNGEKFVVELNIKPFTDDTGWYTGWISVQKDISRESFQHSRDLRNELAIESAGLGTWTWKMDTDEVYWDDRMFDLYGIKRSEANIAYSNWISSVHPDDREAVEKTVQHSAEFKSDWDSNFRIIKPNGHVAHIRARAKIYQSELGEPNLMVGVNWDISDEVASQKELTFQTELASYNAKLASLGELAAGVAHEINNPLSIIEAVTDLVGIKANTDRITASSLKTDLNRIKDAVHRISKIVKGLKSTSSMSQGQIELNPIDLVNEINETLPLLEQIYQKQNIQIRYGNLPKTAFVRGEHGSTQQILMNLMSNAKDAVKSTHSGIITVDLIQHGKYWRLAVHDNGCGIPAELKEKIFEPFVTTKSVGDGTGLGLSICRNLAQSMKGDLTFSSNADDGTSFFLDLETTIDSGASKLRERILLIEDESVVAEVLAEMLAILECEVTIAINGKEGKMLIEQNPAFDIILSDIRMPELSGPEFAAWLVDSGNVNSTSLYFMSGDIDCLSDSESQFIKSHAKGFLEKPISLDALMTFIENFRTQT